MIDPEAPGRKSGFAGLFQRVRCGGEFGLLSGHTLEWVDKGAIQIKRCRECGHIMAERHADRELTEFQRTDKTGGNP